MYNFKGHSTFFTHTTHLFLSLPSSATLRLLCKLAIYEIKNDMASESTNQRIYKITRKYVCWVEELFCVETCRILQRQIVYVQLRAIFNPLTVSLLLAYFINVRAFIPRQLNGTSCLHFPYTTAVQLPAYTFSPFVYLPRLFFSLLSI